LIEGIAMTKRAREIRARHERAKTTFGAQTWFQTSLTVADIDYLLKRLAKMESKAKKR
jgi:hypothetical protein